MSIYQYIKAEAKSLGFLLAGIHDASPPLSFNRYADWIEKGMHASMGYLATEKSLSTRAEPKSILPDCQSVIVLGIPYPSQVTRQPLKPSQGLISSYAWGKDYHSVLLERMERLVFSIEQYLGERFTYRSYTDTGPILERDLGYQAGFGWIGKNSNLINPQYGSLFFLAEIFLSIHLDPSNQPFQHDRCGRCTKCIDACPTQSITQDRTLKAASCISYLTIENKKAIPHEYREKVGTWLFGCDICQTVCPWNQKRNSTRVDTIFDAPENMKVPDLLDVMKLTPENFNKRYKDSPIKRAKRRGLLRNAAVAIGNSRLTDSVPILGQILLDEEDSLIREHAAWALGKIGTADALQSLELAYKQENNNDVLIEIKSSLQELR